MGSKLKFAGFLGRVFLVNTAAGVGAMTGVVLVGVAAAKIAKKVSGKTFTQSVVEAVDNLENS
ncbi:membrane protein [Streptomyces phage Bilo]|nr:membrane protein [Streptomyces phage Bilo]